MNNMQLLNFHNKDKVNIKLSIIIVNYNVSDEVNKCLISIKNILKDFKYEIIVVDNNSEEEEFLEYHSKFKDVKFVFLTDNIGYGPANNIGVNLSIGEFVLILNPDTVFVEDNIISMIDFMDNNVDVGAVTPMLVYQDRSFQYSFGLERGVIVEYLDSLYIFNNLYEKYQKKKLDNFIRLGIPFEVGWISGAFMLMKKKCFEEVGGFSREYKLNYEDMDLCFKIRNKGYKLIYFPEYKCVHLESISQKKEFYNYIYYRYKGRLLFLKNHFSLFHYYFIRIFHIFGLFLRILISYFIFDSQEGKQRRIAFWDSLILYLKF